MSGFGQRVRTIGVLIAGSPVASTPHFPALHQERAALAHSQKIAPSRKALVQIVHTTRLLDTFLARYLPLQGVKPGHSLGGHLIALRDAKQSVAGVHPTIGKLPKARADHYQAKVADVRNLFLHEAGTFPTDPQADDLLADMLACLAEVLLL